MSLRSLHLVTLSVALAACLWLCAWATQRWTTAEERGAPGMVVVATLGAAAIAGQAWWALVRWRGDGQ